MDAPGTHGRIGLSFYIMDRNLLLMHPAEASVFFADWYLQKKFNDLGWQNLSMSSQPDAQSLLFFPYHLLLSIRLVAFMRR